MILLVIIGIQRLIYSLSQLNVINILVLDYNYIGIFLLFISPIYYLFLKNSFSVKKGNPYNLLHLILPLFLGVLIYLNLIEIEGNIVVLCTIFSLIFYSSFIGKELYEFYKCKRKVSIVNEKIFIVGGFSFLLILIFSIFLIKHFLTIYFFDINEFSNLKIPYILSTLVWFFWLIYLFFNPILLYGKGYLISQVDYVKKKELQIWGLNEAIIKTKKELIIEKKINELVYDIINKIKELELDNSFTQSKEMTIENIATKLKIPIYHVKYIFKFYCKLSPTVYKNYIKTNTAIMLMEDNYLKTQTFDSLAKKSLFGSSLTMYNYFKKFYNLSPSEYHKLM